MSAWWRCQSISLAVVNLWMLVPGNRSSPNWLSYTQLKQYCLCCYRMLWTKLALLLMASLAHFSPVLAGYEHSCTADDYYGRRGRQMSACGTRLTDKIIGTCNSIGSSIWLGQRHKRGKLHAPVHTCACTYMRLHIHACMFCCMTG